MFWYVFWIIFGAILDQFWEPNWSQNQYKIDSKFDQISVGFLSGSWTVFDWFWRSFGDPWPSKMELSCGRGANFEKITFFRPDTVLDWFFNDFWWFWISFWGAFWDQNCIQKSIKQSIKFWIDFGRILAPNLAQFWLKFGSKNRSKIKIEFCKKKGMDIRPQIWENRVPKVDQGGPKDHRT